MAHCGHRCPMPWPRRSGDRPRVSAGRLRVSPWWFARLRAGGVLAPGPLSGPRVRPSPPDKHGEVPSVEDVWLKAMKLFRIGYEHWFWSRFYVCCSACFLLGILRPRRRTEWALRPGWRRAGSSLYAEDVILQPLTSRPISWQPSVGRRLSLVCAGWTSKAPEGRKLARQYGIELTSDIHLLRTARARSNGAASATSSRALRTSLRHRRKAVATAHRAVVRPPVRWDCACRRRCSNFATAGCFAPAVTLASKTRTFHHPLLH